MEEREESGSYEALCRRVMGKPIPPEGVVLAERALSLLRGNDDEVDTYERWLRNFQEK
jgi:hypothetical protein